MELADDKKKDDDLTLLLVSSLCSKQHCSASCMRNAIDLICISGDEFTVEGGANCRTALEMGYVTPKLYELLQIFLSFG